MVAATWPGRCCACSPRSEVALLSACTPPFCPRVGKNSERPMPPPPVPQPEDIPAPPAPPHIRRRPPCSARCAEGVRWAEGARSRPSTGLLTYIRHHGLAKPPFRDANQYALPHRLHRGIKRRLRSFCPTTCCAASFWSSLRLPGDCLATSSSGAGAEPSGLDETRLVGAPWPEHLAPAAGQLVGPVPAVSATSRSLLPCWHHPSRTCHTWTWQGISRPACSSSLLWHRLSDAWHQVP